MSLRQDTIAAHPDFPWLDVNALPAIEKILRLQGILEGAARVVRAEKAGQGNMNLTLRVFIEGAEVRSLIVKQSRPWVEKYDSIAAPWERAKMEAAFYDRVQAIYEVESRMPRFLGFDREARALVLEDLGNARDFTEIYTSRFIEPRTLVELAGYLKSLHDATRGQADPRLDNLEMRQLNHAHMYHIPLASPPAVDLDGIERGLADAARTLREDSTYRSHVRSLAEAYLEPDGACLLHGDFFPGSWLAAPTNKGSGTFSEPFEGSSGAEKVPDPFSVRVIDPEFCFFGDPLFDVGVCVGHLALAQIEKSIARMFIDAYGPIDHEMVARIAANEVMRRLIGVAQLPLPNEGQRAAMLLRSREAMVSGSWEALWR
jgi:5-methylthioribose kinase